MIRHRRTVLAPLAAAAAFSLCLAASPAVKAQGGPPGGPGGFGRMGRMFADPTRNNETLLVDRQDVRRELLVSDTEEKQIQDLVAQQQQEIMSKVQENIAQIREKMQTNGQNPQQMDRAQFQTMIQGVRQQMEKQLGPMMEAQLKAVETILTGGQVTRLRQLDLQRRGPLALTDPAVGSQINISQDQTTKLKAILQEYKAKSTETISSVFRPTAGSGQSGNAQAGAQNSAGNGNGNGGPPFDRAAMQERFKQMQTEMDKLRKTEGDKALALLTPAQKQKWTGMQGSIFTFAPDTFGQ